MIPILSSLRGIGALLERSLRIDARQRMQHLFRVAAVLAVYIAIMVSELTGLTFGAPGLRYFRQLAYFNIAFVALAGIGYFSSAITEEKEEETLGLMLMAGISPLGILLGKSWGRLIQAALLITVQLPFTFLAVTLGGVTREQILQAYVSLIMYLVCLANVALVFSVVCRRSRDAAALTLFWQVLYFLLPQLAQSGYVSLVANGWRTGMGGGREALLHVLSWLTQCSVLHQLQEILMTGGTASLLNWQTMSNGIGGILAFLLAWLLFPWGTRDLSPEPPPRGLLFKRLNQGRWFGAGRVVGPALAWKDFHFTCGGWVVAALKITLHAALFAFIAYDFRGSRSSVIHWHDAAELYFGLGMVLLVFDAAWGFGRVFHEEMKAQTWPGLALLPKSVPELVYGKCLGVMASLLPTIACLSIPFVLGTLTWHDVAENLESSEFWVLVAVGVTFIHLTALYSVVLKWGALPLAIATMIGMIFAWNFLFISALRMSGTPYLISWMFVGFLFVCSAISQALILLRMEQATAS